MRRVVLAAGVAAVACGLGFGGCATLAGSAVATLGGPAGTAPASPPDTNGPAPAGSGETAPFAARPAVPAAWEVLDRGAAATCHGLSWSVLAAIGDVESDSGRSALPGVGSGSNAAGAEGPMQFEPATFAAHAVVGPGGASPPSPYDPVDAVYSAAALLCADGGGAPGGLYRAVWDYDHSAAYVGVVLVLARALAAEPGLGAVPGAALAFAAGRLGAPYRWGGTGPVGYDCSGLVQAAYRAAGVELPRVAQAQFDAGPRVPATAPPLPGDLVFFGSSATDVTHVGLYVGDGWMLDAPHAGAVVRVEASPTVPGRAWGAQRYVGATRPGG